MTKYPLNTYHYAAKSITKMRVNELLAEARKNNKATAVVNEIARRNSAKDWHLFVFGLNKDNTSSKIIELLEEPLMKYMWSRASSLYESTIENMLWRYTQLADSLGAKLKGDIRIQALSEVHPRYAAIVILSSSMPTVMQTSLISKYHLNQTSQVLIDNHIANQLEEKGIHNRSSQETGLLVLYYIMEALQHGYVWGSIETFNIFAMRLHQDNKDPFMTEAAKANLNPEAFAMLVKLPDSIMTPTMLENLSNNHNPSSILGWYLSINPQEINTEEFIAETPKMLEWLTKNPAYGKYFDLVWDTIKKYTLSSPMALKKIVQQPPDNNPFFILFELSPELAQKVMSFFTYEVGPGGTYNLSPQIVNRFIEQSIRQPELMSILRDWDYSVLAQIPMKPFVRQTILQEPKVPSGHEKNDSSVPATEEDELHNWLFSNNSSWYRRAHAR